MKGLPRVTTQVVSGVVQKFAEDGFAVVGEVIAPGELAVYRDIYDRLLSGDIESGDKRSDLGSHVPRKEGVRENITQIMWPSALYPPLRELPLHEKALAVARELIGDDAELDFDMMIHKAPHTGVPTPWHQDAAYWVDMPDHRAVSIWVALDDADLDNGCMWYGKGSHRQPLRPHRPTSDGKNIECDCSEGEAGATPVPLPAGSAVAHSGSTLHYSRGNTTGGNRRAYILNYRPAAMIRLEREQGADHGLNENVRQVRNPGAAEN
ncbi:phytanoyl-CoA dioxygenase family protein [Streptomyces sp. NPDC054841]